MANFKLRFIRDFFHEVVTDYERSFIGSFCGSLIALINSEEHDYNLELYMTITKFEENMGFSLV